MTFISQACSLFHARKAKRCVVLAPTHHDIRALRNCSTPPLARSLPDVFEGYNRVCTSSTDVPMYKFACSPEYRGGG